MLLKNWFSEVILEQTIPNISTMNSKGLQPLERSRLAFDAAGVYLEVDLESRLIENTLRGACP